GSVDSFAQGAIENSGDAVVMVVVGGYDEVRAALWSQDERSGDRFVRIHRDADRGRGAGRGAGPTAESPSIRGRCCRSHRRVVRIRPRSRVDGDGSVADN